MLAANRPSEKAHQKIDGRRAGPCGRQVEVAYSASRFVWWVTVSSSLVVVIKIIHVDVAVELI